MKEPLAVSAPLAHDWSARFCCADDGRGGDCAWYHGMIQYLRILDVVATPITHRDFYVDNIRAFAAGGVLDRVLVSGAADCAMALQVIDGLQAAGSAARVVVTDRCETPMRLNRWFAERESLGLETRVSDIRDFDAGEPFDLICTHCFLGYFDPDERVRVAAKWCSLLRPGGKVLTVTPVRPVPTTDPTGFNPEQARAFRERVRKAAADRGGLPGLDADELDRMVAVYTDRLRMVPVRSGEEITDFFAAGGLTVEEICGADGAPLPRQAGMGPTETGVAYATIVARRD